MIIGTAGHIDHGKTSLVHALTGVDTDRLKEEKARGISIDLGFAYLPGQNGEIIGFVDVPGHERFVHNMLAGATGIDFVLLVVAADDGIMQQTREHLAIVDLLGLRRGIVALTKIDLVSQTRRAQVESEIGSLLSETGLAGSEIRAVSCFTREGIEELRSHLLRIANLRFEQKADGRFRMSVDRCFTLAGAGTVVTGTVLSGTVSVGDKVMVSPTGLGARIRSIHAQNRPVQRGEAGQRCALNLSGEHITKNAIARGEVVLDPDLHAPTTRIDATLRVLASEPKSIAHWTPVRIHHGAAEVGARLVVLGDLPVPPGGESLVQLVLEEPLAVAVGDRFIVRDTTAQRTLGGGSFLDLRAPARKRRTPERVAQLRALAITETGENLSAQMGCAPHYVDLSAFARDRALASEAVEKIAHDRGAILIPVKASIFALGASEFALLRGSVVSALQTFHAENPDFLGMGIEKLRLQLEPRLPSAVFHSLLQGFVRDGEIAIEGAWVRLPHHKVQLTQHDERIWTEVRDLLAGPSRFRPPRVRDIAGVKLMPEAEIRRLLKLLGRMGKLYEIAHDHFFLRGTLAEIVATVVDLAARSPDGQFTAAHLRDRLDNGRKVAIQILEFLDRQGVTLRRGDARRINKHRLDLFQPPSGEEATAGEFVSGGESSLVGRPDFKSGRGREPVFGGFDSHSLPPQSHGTGR
jgi:selenocysteine-specific elongation factor